MTPQDNPRRPARKDEGGEDVPRQRHPPQRSRLDADDDIGTTMPSPVRRPPTGAGSGPGRSSPDTAPASHTPGGGSKNK